MKKIILIVALFICITSLAQSETKEYKQIYKLAYKQAEAEAYAKGSTKEDAEYYAKQYAKEKADREQEKIRKEWLARKQAEYDREKERKEKIRLEVKNKLDSEELTEKLAAEELTRKEREEQIIRELAKERNTSYEVESLRQKQLKKEGREPDMMTEKEAQEQEDEMEAQDQAEYKARKEKEATWTKYKTVDGKMMNLADIFERQRLLAHSDIDSLKQREATGTLPEYAKNMGIEIESIINEYLTGKGRIFGKKANEKKSGHFIVFSEQTKPNKGNIVFVSVWTCFWEDSAEEEKEPTFIYRVDVKVNSLNAGEADNIINSAYKKSVQKVKEFSVEDVKFQSEEYELGC